MTPSDDKPVRSPEPLPVSSKRNCQSFSEVLVPRVCAYALAKLATIEQRHGHTRVQMRVTTISMLTSASLKPPHSGSQISG
jgi:hypothetical protein